MHWGEDIAFRRRVGVVAWLLASILLISLWSAFLKDHDTRTTFTYRRVSGRLTYADGGRIPAEAISLIFCPLGEGDNSTIVRPPSSVAVVDVNTGQFSSATSQYHGDGAVYAECAVVIVGKFNPGVVPVVYGDKSTTPLRVWPAQNLRLGVVRP
jgi:hypothetical protein